MPLITRFLLGMSYAAFACLLCGFTTGIIRVHALSRKGPDLEIARALRDLEHKFVNSRKNIYHKSRTKATRDTNPALTSVL